MAKLKKKSITNGKVRWNFRVPKDVDEWAKKYAFENNTTVTQVVLDYFTEMMKKSQTEHVEQV